MKGTREFHKDPGITGKGIGFLVCDCYCLRTPDQDMAPAWQRHSRTEAGRDFLVLFGNAKQKQDVISMHNLRNNSYLRIYTILAEKNVVND